MTVVGITMVRDEADVIAGTLRHMADEVDSLLVADNGSVDRTREILIQLQRELPMRWVDDPDPAYYQSRKMTALADRAAAELGATWIVPFDADELWHGPCRVRDLLAVSDADVVTAKLFNHFATALDPAGDDPMVTMQWRQREPAPLPKAAFRWEPGCVIHQGNHGVTRPSPSIVRPLLSIRHFPARSVAQFARKATNGAQAYAAAADLPEGQGAHWRAYGRLIEAHGHEILHDVFRSHWWYLSPLDAGLIHDPAPYRRWRIDDAEA